MTWFRLDVNGSGSQYTIHVGMTTIPKSYYWRNDWYRIGDYWKVELLMRGLSQLGTRRDLMTKWMVLEVNEKERQYRITVVEDPWQAHTPGTNDWAAVGSYKKIDDLMAALTSYLNMEQSKGA